jgi:hypothetical protein
LLYGQRSPSINDTRSVLDGIGNIAFVAIAKHTPVLVSNRRRGATASSPSYALPTNLPSALSHLDDDQLNRLHAAVIGELEQRGKTLSISDEPSRKQRTKVVASPLAQGKLNAVCAAFKAGVKPSRIAKQFGISLADVRKAVAGDPSK